MAARDRLWAGQPGQDRHGQMQASYRPPAPRQASVWSARRGFDRRQRAQPDDPDRKACLQSRLNIQKPTTNASAFLQQRHAAGQRAAPNRADRQVRLGRGLRRVRSAQRHPGHCGHRGFRPADRRTAQQCRHPVRWTPTQTLLAGTCPPRSTVSVPFSEPRFRSDPPHALTRALGDLRPSGTFPRCASRA